MKGTILKQLLFLTVLSISPVAFGQTAAAQKTSGGAMRIRLYFPRADPDKDNELVAVERTVKRTKRTADAALRELFKGVTETDRKNGLDSAFSVASIVTGRAECAREKMKPLGAYYRGVAIEKGVATVNFTPEAECYLQSAIYMMSRVMNPIEATLKQFSTIKEVRFALDGRVITEWDA